MRHRTRDEHLFDAGPKRILSLDGGGIRGTLSLEYLRRIEELLRARHGGDPDFRLSDYFDLIAGNSTGAIIAGALVLGFPVERLQRLYCDLGNEIFKRPSFRLGFISPKFPREPLANELAEAYGDATLGSDAVRTGVMIALKRVDTGSPWMVHNSPRGKHYDAGDASTPNRDYLLRQVVYASSAAPHYFEPERLEVAPGVDGIFVDGGVGAAVNPALHSLMVATLDGYGLRWPTGADNLLLVSVGTGVTITRMTADEAIRAPALPSAVNALVSALNDVDWLVQTVLQWFSECPTRWQVDSEIGDLAGDRFAEQPLLTYLRYNAVFESKWLEDELGLSVDEARVRSLVPMDNADSIGLLAEIGRLAAQKQIRDEHFPVCFDLAAF